MSRKSLNSAHNLQSLEEQLIEDLKLDNGVENVFKQLISDDPFDDENGDSDGLELDKKTSHDHTMLHCIVNAMADSPSHMKYYLQIVDKIRARSAQWYLKYKPDKPGNRSSDDDNCDGNADNGDLNADNGDGNADNGDRNGDYNDGNDDNGDGNADNGDGNADNGDRNADIERQNDRIEMQNDNNYTKIVRYSAMCHLLFKSHDMKGKTVWDLALERNVTEMVEKIMNMKEVTWGNGNVFNVSMLIDMDTSKKNVFLHALTYFCNKGVCEAKLFALLKQTKNTVKFDELMRVKPIKKLTDHFCSISTKMYFVYVFFHIVYMSLISYLGCELTDARNPELTETTKWLMYTIGPTEPVVISCYLLHKLFKLIGKYNCNNHAKSSSMDKCFVKMNYVWEILWFLIILVHNVLLVVVIFSVESEITPTKRNILSVCLLFGWILTTALANGIRQVNFFFKLVLKVICIDVPKIFLVYIIFLLGFSFSIHVQFISSPNITMTYTTPVHTMYLMFNVMMGMDEAIDDVTELYLESASASPLMSKLLYIGYVVCSSIILLNLLIAVMNTSYSQIEVEHRHEWVFNAVHFGSQVTKHFSMLANFLGTCKIKKRDMFDNVSVTSIKLDLSPSDTPRHSHTDLTNLEHRIQHSETLLNAQISQKVEDMKYLQNEMLSCIRELQAKFDMQKLEGSSTA